MTFAVILGDAIDLQSPLHRINIGPLGLFYDFDWQQTRLHEGVSHVAWALGYWFYWTWLNFSKGEGNSYIKYVVDYVMLSLN